jgi:hypothetical protein
MNRTTRDLAWWYWLLTVGLLAAGIAGQPWGTPLAMFLCTVQLAHFSWFAGSITAFPVQVRLAYLGVLAAGLWPPLQWIHLVQLIGTSARVQAGYFLLGRPHYQAPWNRVEPLSASLVRRTFFSLQSAIAPCGSILRRLPYEAEEY